MFNLFVWRLGPDSLAKNRFLVFAWAIGWMHWYWTWCINRAKKHTHSAVILVECFRNWGSIIYSLVVHAMCDSFMRLWYHICIIFNIHNIYIYIFDYLYVYIWKYISRTQLRVVIIGFCFHHEQLGCLTFNHKWLGRWVSAIGFNGFSRFLTWGKTWSKCTTTESWWLRTWSF